MTDNKLKLEQGLNCIRVAKSCDIFITSNAPDGLLCFDTLRLVDVSPTDNNQGATYGLNLEQLGYLNTSDEGTWNEIDSRARKNLKNTLTKDALEKIESRLQELNNNVDAAKEALDEDKPKVEKIEVGYIGGDYQEVFINGNSHWFNIHWSDITILEELEKYYDFTSNEA